MRVLGIGLSHCCGVCLIEDGRIVFAQEEDRFSRRRRHKGWPESSLRYLFETFDLDEHDIDLCVLCDEQTATNLGRRIAAKKTITVHHHLAHIMSSWALAPWQDFEAISIDGGGDFGSWQSFGSFQDRKLKDWVSNCGSKLSGKSATSRPFWRRRRPGIPFGSYWSAPAVLNFGMLDRNGTGGYEGKLMGLAAHGRADQFDCKAMQYDASFSIKRRSGRFELSNSGHPKIGNSEFCVLQDGTQIPIAEVRRLRKSEGRLVHEYDLADPNHLSLAANFAALLQDRTDQAMTALFEANYTPGTKVAASGGSFANVVSNGALKDRWDLFIVPPMGDEGLALGAAAWGAHILGMTEIQTTTMYLGFDAGSNEGIAVNEVAALLDENAAIGLIEGRSELGPRALGARTILADPRDENNNQSINERLGRVEYMPFAPVIMEEHAEDVLSGWREKHLSAAHMTLVYSIQDKWCDRLKGVVHADGTVRPQVLSRETNPVYYDILNAWYKRTGLPVLINTSFNAHGEPMLRTVEEGLKAVQTEHIDALVAGGKIHTSKSFS